MYIDIYRYRYTDIYVDIYIDIYFYDQFFNHQYRLCFTTRLPAVPDLFDSGRNVGGICFQSQAPGGHTTYFGGHIIFEMRVALKLLSYDQTVSEANDS